jgi:hypothetical protein
VDTMKVIATMSIVVACIVNFYVGGLMQGRYGKFPWYNLLTGIVLLGCIIHILVKPSL